MPDRNSEEQPSPETDESFNDQETTYRSMIFSKYLSKILGHERKSVAEYKFKQAFEKAKYLSVNKDFQAAVSELRARWNPSPFLPPENMDEGHLFPEYFLRNCFFNKDAPDQVLENLHKDLEESLCKPFNLDWIHDYGLIVIAACIGLTSENIINHWEKMKFAASVNISSGVTISYIHQDGVRREKWKANLTIIYLAKRLQDGGILLGELPATIKDVIQKSVETMKPNEKNINPLSAPKIIEFIQNRPKEKPTLILEIAPETTKADIDRIWPLVELRKLQLGEKPAKLQRTWRTYERDVFIWKKVREDGLTYENAYDEWLDENPNEDPVEITAIIKAINRIDNI